jgi:hypothetical protein
MLLLGELVWRKLFVQHPQHVAWKDDHVLLRAHQHLGKLLFRVFHQLLGHDHTNLLPHSGQWLTST